MAHEPRKKRLDFVDNPDHLERHENDGYLGFNALPTATFFFDVGRDFALDVGLHELGSELPPSTAHAGWQVIDFLSRHNTV